MAVMSSIPELWGDSVADGKIAVVLNADDIELVMEALK